MKQYRDAFTMIELVFVIVIIGILSAIAVPKFAATRDDAIIVKARSTIAAVRSAIATERQKQILRGGFADLNKTAIGTNFANLLTYSVKSCSTSRCNGWQTGGTEANPTYTFHGPTGDVTYTFQNKRLECTGGSCSTYGN